MKYLYLPFLKTFLLIFALTINSLAYSFKPDTHVWIGQEALNDAFDGKLTFDLRGKIVEIPISTELKNALDQFPDAYRMGNIGPDAAPDIATGQSVIHPGVKGGWQTDDWVEWLLEQARTPEEIAYAYGYLGHVASDSFAHTYVNMYAGGKFDLLDGEIDIEQRHFMLETFIANRTPPTRDIYGNNLGLEKELIKSPAPFIADKLIFNDDVANQYSKTKVKHLYFIHTLRKKVREFIDGPLHDAEIYLIKKVAEDVFGMELSDDEAEQILEIQRGIRAAIVDHSENLQKFHREIFKGYADIAEMQGDFVQVANGVNVITEYNDLLVGLNEEISKTEELLSSITKYETITEDCPFLACKAVEKTVITQAWTSQNTILQNLISERAQLQTDFENANDTVQNTLAKIKEERVNAVGAIDDIFQIIVELGQIYGGGSSPFGGALENWEKEIRLGMIAYIEANDAVIKRLMHSEEEPFQPLKDWYDCWGITVFTSIPNAATCGAYARFSDALEAIHDAKIKALEEYGEINPLADILADLYILVDDLKEAVLDKAQEEVIEAISGITGQEVEKLLAAANSKASNEELNVQFASNQSSLHLLNISNMAQRVEAEMYIKNGYFDKRRFAVIRNAVTLVKLSLLDQEGLNQLASSAGITNGGAYGYSLFGYSGNKGDKNVLFDAIRNIDGNHQWREFAPFYPRDKDHPDQSEKENRTYGYGFSDETGNEKGFRFWQDNNAQTKLFKNLFIGPLSPGLNNPTSLGFSEVLPADYIDFSANDLGSFFELTLSFVDTPKYCDHPDKLVGQVPSLGANQLIQEAKALCKDCGIVETSNQYDMYIVHCGRLTEIAEPFPTPSPEPDPPPSCGSKLVNQTALSCDAGMSSSEAKSFAESQCASCAARTIAPCNGGAVWICDAAPEPEPEPEPTCGGGQTNHTALSCDAGMSYSDAKALAESNCTSCSARTVAPCGGGSVWVCN